MQLRSVLLLTSLAAFASARPQPEAEVPPGLEARATCNKWDGAFCIDGFGGRTPSSGSGVTYKGNLGNPYGSNIIRVDSSIAAQYKYTVKFVGSSRMAGNYKIVIWNKIGPDGGVNGFFTPNKAIEFSLAPNQEIFVAFDQDTNGGWGAALGNSLPLTDWGTYASNWGEFDFGSNINGGWSGFDVSMIVAQNAGKAIQGMRICDITSGARGVCSTITTGAKRVENAYTVAQTGVGGIGGNLGPGKVRLEAIIEFAD